MSELLILKLSTAVSSILLLVSVFLRLRSDRKWAKLSRRQNALLFEYKSQIETDKKLLEKALSRLQEVGE